MSFDLMQFKCRACASFWVRRYAANGSFSWIAPEGEQPGKDVPGRPGTAPP
jgi:reverse gyrase